MPSFIDLFAGAGGFSEGFLQAEYNDKYFDFLLASDINKTCEVTHRMRYNYQLNLNTEFLTKDITDSDFLEVLQSKIEQSSGTKNIDVVVGGPPCQSFSMAGARRKNDKKDDLFSYYLEVISMIKPKYFVMENVSGILTKYNGKVKERILNEINSITDFSALNKYLETIDKIASPHLLKNANYNMLINKLQICIELDLLKNQRSKQYLEVLKKINSDIFNESEVSFITTSIQKEKKNIYSLKYISYIDSLTNMFISSFRNSKFISEEERNVVRQALSLIKHKGNLDALQHSIVKEINESQLDASVYKINFDKLTDYLDLDSIIEILNDACDHIINKTSVEVEINAATTVKQAISILFDPILETINQINNLTKEYITETEYSTLLTLTEQIHLYRIEKECVLLSSDYGVPQHRTRVVFIGCRNDQPLITSIPATVSEDEKVTASEALDDLLFIHNNSTETEYNEDCYQKAIQNKPLRTVNGKLVSEAKKMTYIEWSRKGRLNPDRFPKIKKPPYTSANTIEEMDQRGINSYSLANHQMSNQNEIVRARYSLIRKYGGFQEAKKNEPNNPLLKTNKRSYSCLDSNKPSQTITTMSDDYAHYGADRSLTVREMARLQSFDDSFVFQGKRTTGGDRRKFETPQYTQVGNAIPPLMAHAIALEILKNIR